MIRYIKGSFHPLGEGNQVIIENGSGIGFLITIPANSPLYGNVEGETVKVYTHMIVREDDMSLYGFHSMDELRLFAQLITVNGVGAKAGMALMSILPVMELRRAIATGDVKTLSKAAGVGKKTAERVVLDLKDKMGDFADAEPISGEAMDFSANDNKTEAVNALMALGYTKNEAETVIGKIPEADLSVEDYIKRALKNLF